MESNNASKLPKNHPNSAGVGGTEADDVQPQHNSSDNENNENEFDDFANMGGSQPLSGASGTNATSNIGGLNNNSGSAIGNKEGRVASVNHESPRFINKKAMGSNQILTESNAHAGVGHNFMNRANNMDNSHHSIADEISATSGDNGSNFADMRFTEGMQIS